MTTTERLKAEAVQLLEDHREMLDGQLPLRLITLALSLRRDGVKSNVKLEFERER